ncbi:MAG TPA: hypothetical protein VNX02_11325 [Steroidobacteraceae bacterium]|jgi:hypothetical protein|nr:hypothetical protein [Steroidobacteraceae bacterium]
MSGGYYKIVEAQLPLLAGLGGHNLIAVLNPAGNVIYEFDGLATSSSGEIKPIGYLPSDTLKVYEYTGQAYYNADDPQSTLVASDSLASLQPYITAMTTCKNDINAENLSYPFLGLGTNSNSVASTLDACMGVPEPTLIGSAPITPGVGTLVLSPTVINSVEKANGLDQESLKGLSSVSGESTGSTTSTVDVTNGDGTTSTATMTISGADGVATLMDSDSAADKVFTQTNTIQSSGNTSVAVNGYGDTLGIEGATLSLAASTGTESMGVMGLDDIIDIGTHEVGKNGALQGGTVDVGADMSDETIDIAGDGAADIDLGNDASAVINGKGDVDMGDDDQVLVGNDSIISSVGTGTDNVVDVGASDYTTIDQSGDDVVGKGQDTVIVGGTNDHVYDDDSTIDVEGSDTGDIVYGEGDTGSGWGGYVKEGGSYGGYGGGGYYGYGGDAIGIKGDGKRSASERDRGRGVDIATIAARDAFGTTSSTVYGGQAAATTQRVGIATPDNVSETTLWGSYVAAGQLVHAMAKWSSDGGAFSETLPEGGGSAPHFLTSLTASSTLRAREDRLMHH